MTIEKIAKTSLGISLEIKNSDSLDFYDLSVWQVKEALERAYQLGVQSTEKPQLKKITVFNIIGYDKINNEKKYTKAKVFIKVEGKELSWEVRFYLPSGEVNKTRKSIFGEKLIDNEYIPYIQNEFRRAIEEYLEIPYDMQMSLPETTLIKWSN